MVELSVSEELAKIKQEQARLEEIIKVLREDTSYIPQEEWNKHFPDGIMLILAKQENPLLPNEYPLNRDGIRYIPGGALVYSALLRSGRIMYVMITHGSPYEEGHPNEILGEASLKDYEESLPFAQAKLTLVIAGLPIGRNHTPGV